MSTLGAGFFGPTEGETRRRIQGAEAQLAWQKGVHPNQPKRRRDASPWLPPLSIDPPPDEEKATLKKDLHSIGVNALSSADHDFCDACGKLTVVTDVWINRLPVTLCQPCILDALTAEGESLGRYWEIES